MSVLFGDPNPTIEGKEPEWVQGEDTRTKGRYERSKLFGKTLRKGTFRDLITRSESGVSRQLPTHTHVHTRT